MSLSTCCLPCLFAVLATSLVGQTTTLGTAADPCTGGAPLTIVGTTNTVRWGDFTCRFPVAEDGLYSVRLDFLDPCHEAGACSGSPPAIPAQVTKAGQRVFHVFVQDSPALWNFDGWTAGLNATAPRSRSVLSYSSGGIITVRVQTVVRSGVLSAVTIGPFSAVQISQYQCIGNGPGFDCAGLQLLKFTSPDGTIKYFAGISDVPAATAIGQCPQAAGVPCWQAIPITTATTLPIVLFPTAE